MQKLSCYRSRSICRDDRINAPHGFKIGTDPRVFEIGNPPLARVATKGDPRTRDGVGASSSRTAARPPSPGPTDQRAQAARTGGEAPVGEGQDRDEQTPIPHLPTLRTRARPEPRSSGARPTRGPQPVTGGARVYGTHRLAQPRGGRPPAASLTRSSSRLKRRIVRGSGDVRGALGERPTADRSKRRSSQPTACTLPRVELPEGSDEVAPMWDVMAKSPHLGARQCLMELRQHAGRGGDETGPE